MRDSEVLRELREYDAGVPPLDAVTWWRVRVRLLAAVKAENEPAPAVRHRRPVLRIALTGTVAAAVAAGVLVAEHGNDSAEGLKAAPPSATSPAMRNVSAQTVLNRAATYARQHEQMASPRDDQFIYTKEIVKETDENTGHTKTYTDEDWLSVDDSKPSWIEEVGKGWWAPPHAPGESSWPPEDWGTLKKLPTDPKQLILSLGPPGSGEFTPVAGSTPQPVETPWRTGATVPPGTEDEWLSKISEMGWQMVHEDLSGLLRVPVLPEGLRPAAYEALSMVPGVKVVPNQKDAQGRIGVAIAYDDKSLGQTGLGNYLIFDPRTYEFLGYRDDSSLDRSVSWTVQLSSLESWAIVDKAKQRP